MTVMNPQPFDQEDDVEMMLVPQPDFVDIPAPVEEDEVMPVTALESDSGDFPHPLLLEGPQPMEVVANAAGENQAVAVPPPQASRLTWTIENFSGLDEQRIFSDEFVAGGNKWKVMIFPKGNRPHAEFPFFSMFLAVADPDCLPLGWSCHTKFSLTVVNQVDCKYSRKEEVQNMFNQHNTDWGFPHIIPLSELHDPEKGFLVNDTLLIEAVVSVRKSEDFWGYDSKKETGFVGLKNQGATCYMNSLLQTLFHIPFFRKAVYHMPATESGSIALALLRLFYKLQYSDKSVATRELTKSFGWNTYDSFMQQDVQELNRVLCEKLEEKMKGTVVEGTIQKLFCGHLMNYIECINVEFKSTRKESFYDLQLDVKGCKDVYASFDKYVEVEHLEEANQYHAEGHGLQDAKKGVLFTDFPPVLQLHLKRFEYDFTCETMVKINDRYEFPLQLDLDRENGKYLSPDADKSVRNLYTLHSVLVHSGGGRGGHYYAFIRPTIGDQWYKFDDERVTREDVNRALEEQYGSEAIPAGFTKYSSAYMLVYIRERDKDKIICDVDENDIAEDLRTRLKEEEEEKARKRRIKAEAHLFTNVKVSRDEHLREQLGKDICFDLVDHSKSRNFRLQKQMPFNLFKEEIAEETGVPVEYQRFWLWAMRKNFTFRLDRPLTSQEETKTVGQLIREVSTRIRNVEFSLFLEVEYDMDLRPVPLPKKTKEDILLFFKVYDPEKEELLYVGRLFVKSSGKPSEILEKLKELAGFYAEEDIEIFEEVKFEPDVICKPLDRSSWSGDHQIQDGDIIYIQKRLSTEHQEQLRCPDIPSYFDYIKNRLVVHFRSLETPKDDDFCLELAKNDTYDDVVERVAEKLDLDDPSRIRLTPHCVNFQRPKQQPIKYRATSLLDMLVHFNRISDILYYEVLEIPLPELESLKTMEVAFHPAAKDKEVVILKLRLLRQSTVKDLLEEIKAKVELSPNAELRLLELYDNKIRRIFPLETEIDSIFSYCYLRAEEVLEEEKNLGPHDRLIQVYHFAKGEVFFVRTFGDPFILAVHEGETIGNVKLRLQKRLQVPDEEFAKSKFAFQGCLEPEDAEEVIEIIPVTGNVYDCWGLYSVGLEHPDKTPRTASYQIPCQKYGTMNTLLNHNFAAILPGDSVASIVATNVILNFLNIYNTVLVVRLVLTWFPNAPPAIVSPLSAAAALPAELPPASGVSQNLPSDPMELHRTTSQRKWMRRLAGGKPNAS
ncbi:OLC1v1032001C1 [Oldenlandia corymbosa var. corymbosa]|uniref:ubiquitinyl hydrolase 1 n=1 Tax=Oldenlandia corymbosa var. corymbosa TaxID=529605 RepID=A0AAV1CJY2_OLDCO|nr:OLC1v1032001C1 [Oldenlandia corymbosa var. corymbosa]